MLEIGLDARAFSGVQLAAIGAETAAALRDELGLRADLFPASFVAEALADALERGGHVRGKRFLLLRADIARPLLRERLQAAGAAELRDIPIYETHAPPSLPAELIEAMDQHRVDWITFTSSSTARNFSQLLGKDYATQLAGVKLASIGPVTTATLKELGLTPTVEGRTFNIDGVVQAILSGDCPLP